MPLPKYLAQKLERMKYPIIIRREGKHGDGFYVASDRAALLAVFVAMVRFRVDVDGYIDAHDKDVRRVLEERDGEGALVILWDRRDAEYEGIEFIIPEPT